MKLFSISDLLLKALATFKRFPITLIWVTLNACTLVILAEQDADRIFEEYLNITLIAILGVSWLIGARFYTEQFRKKQLYWINICILLLVLGFYFSLPAYDPAYTNQDSTPYIRWTLYFIAGHVTLLFAPFVSMWHPKAYWNYLGRVIIAIARSTLFSGVLYLGLVLALLAVKYLFDVNVKGYRYFQLFIICLGIVHTWVYLSDFPKEIQHNIHLTFNKATEVFVKYILIPLAALYMLILYAYALKIVLQWELPKGWVSYLVTALAGLLFSIQFCIHPVRSTHSSRWIRGFQPLAYWLLLPLLVLLYTAIYKRVSDYGVTEARYFLIVIAVFSTGATLYLIFSRKQQLRYIPFALAILAILGSFGVWGAFSVSKRSQLHEFENVYAAFVKAPSIPISREQADRFVSISSYLDQRNELPKTRYILGYDPKEAFPDASRWQIGHTILDSLGLNISEDTQSNKTLLYAIEGDQPYAIKGYDRMRKIYFTKNRQHHNATNTIGTYSFLIHSDGKNLVVKYLDSEVMSVSLTSFIDQLPKKVPDYTYTTLTLEQLSVVASNAQLQLKIFFNDLSIFKDGNTYLINDGSAYILLKEVK